MKKLIIVLGVFLAANAVGFAQSDTVTSKKEDVKKTTYTCPMHPKEVSDKEGKCSQCGMELVEKSTLKRDPTVKGSQTKVITEKMYVCPMHPRVMGEKGDKCPKCGMEMILKEGEKTEHNHKN